MKMVKKSNIRKKIFEKFDLLKGLGCDGTFDELLCWEATAANTSLSQKCPEFEGMLDSTSMELL